MLFMNQIQPMHESNIIQTLIPMKENSKRSQQTLPFRIMQWNKQSLDHVTGRKEITNGNLPQITVYFPFLDCSMVLSLISFRSLTHTHCSFLFIRMNKNYFVYFTAAVLISIYAAVESGWEVDLCSTSLSQTWVGPSWAPTRPTSLTLT